MDNLDECSKVITLDDILKNSNEEVSSNTKEDVVTPAGMREILADEKKHTRFIENPLPVPKRKAHKELDYSIFVSDTDDFDIKDMTGIDYFDID